MIALDTFALLRSIAGAPGTFASVEDDLERLAVAAITKLLKAKGMTLEGLRALNAAVGPDTLGFILGHDSMTDADIKGLVRKLDQHWPKLANARPDSQRNHLLDLAAGTDQPVEPDAPPRPARTVAATTQPATWSKAMSARLQKVVA